MCSYNGCVTEIKEENNPAVSYSYDALLRRNSKELNIGSGFLTEYKYKTAENGNTTFLVSSLKNGNDTLTYSYDDVGNIETISENGVLKNTYHYDTLNQLIREDNVGVNTITYSYDNGGNITEVKLNGNTVKSYTYGDTSWKDLLTGFNNQTITYDNIGNPLAYRDGFSFTWSGGRQLTGITNNTDSILYSYNADGLRIQKTVNNTVTDYYWLNGVLQAQKTGNEHIIFLYDENGSAYGFLIKNGATEAYYYYLFNAQGDVIGILDSNGSLVVSYTYDAWGKLLSVTGTGASTIGQINPIRYRGYYFDSETHFYYLQSRYYDPETGRFLNADGQIDGSGESVQGYNLFDYCNNNPVNMSDDTGHWPTCFNKIVNNVVKAVKEIVERVLTVKEDVPLYSQGDTKLCWAYTQIMVEDYKSGIVRTQKEAEKRAIQVAKKVNGDNWNRGSVPQNRGEPVRCKSCMDLFFAISKYGPLNASYGCYEGDQIVAGHSVVVTGVNVVKGTVYTNNPWGIYGEQSYEEFIQIFTEGSGEGWKLDACYRLN